MSKKILVVEDESALMGAMKEFLLAENFSVVTADDGEEAMMMVKKEKPDLILLDIVLPKKDGFAVLAELKADVEMEKIPVMLLTNLESADDVDRAFSLGVSTYLVKSNYKLEEIVEKIKEMLKI
ncbi:MAG: Transcriptional regulatory protein [Candidatus Moranbacteria bacterium GW2011_GWA2_39_41]|nr:MAG: Transcriptional regulatory protein [Candidatus Moranbacteria bacterium GW2011_GWA2_39_41]